MSDSILAWHFSDGELRFDYAGMKVEAGLVLETEKKPIAEKNGFHASIRALDALSWYAVRPQTEFIISRVRVSGEMINGAPYKNGTERIVAQKREHLWVADAKAVLEEFAEINRPTSDMVSQSDIDLCVSIWNRIDSNFSDLGGSQESIKDDKDSAMYLLFFPASKPFDEIDLAQIPVRSLGNYVLSFAYIVSKLNHSIYKLKVWETAVKDGFDIKAYVKPHFFFPLGRLWTFQNPPEEYKALVTAPKDPAETLHEMLMRLAPEGYRE
jgi:hypothetical protein